ncbi:hypothetical protein F9L16_21135 [Agarivorans sp. B2Z047]|uniref:hypothetical protein n=1 Tax=Agarivorans sp. B2Z047 TaxID=2652721 RepID=UPI00128B710F|nr:hypothetical protein [Agarivorans sp. B2Z047]MPW31482.1 hypothetical protein [Agarivorans sp. B2Z047]UQN42525.1 hypothetical protein LQZ07_22565 [Agarivorans sp. B2Z047]
MSETKIYVFSGTFSCIEEACLYSQPQWEPEPDESVSDDEYEKWEDSNPSHQLEKNIDSYLDEDFIETVDLNYEYLKSFKLSESDMDKVKEKSAGDNIFVLVFEDALGGFRLENEPKSTSQLNFCGAYKCVL